jgi:hypothetical protein
VFEIERDLDGSASRGNLRELVLRQVGPDPRARFIGSDEGFRYQRHDEWHGQHETDDAADAERGVCQKRAAGLFFRRPFIFV